MNGNLKINGLVFVLLSATTALALPPEVADPHHGRVLQFEPNGVDVIASLGIEFGAFVVADGTKKGGGGEGVYGEPYADISVDFTHHLSEKNVLGLSLNFIEPETALLKIEDDRRNRVNNRGFLYGPKWRTAKFFWRHTSDTELYQVDFGLDEYLGYRPLFGRYQGSTPLLLRDTQYFDRGGSFTHEFHTRGRKGWRFRLCLLDGEGWLGLEDGWFQKSYPCYGAQAEIHPLNLFATDAFLDWFGDLSLLVSWTNAEGGSSPGSKEKFEHCLYGFQYYRRVFGLDFESRFLTGTIIRGSNDVDRHEVTSAWVWENLLSGVKCGKSSLDGYFSLSDANHESGDPYWLWRNASTTYEKQWMLGIQVNEPFGAEHLSVLVAYFQKTMDGQRSWRALEDNGIWGGLKYQW